MAVASLIVSLLCIFYVIAVNYRVDGIERQSHSDNVEIQRLNSRMTHLERENLSRR